MKRLLVSTISLAALVSAGTAPAQADELPDRVELGRNSQQQPCAATRYWGDAAVDDPFADSFAITCRGAIGNRYTGVARSVKRPTDISAIEASLECGAASQVTIPGLGSASARRCFDSMLGFETIETSAARGTQRLSVSAIPANQAPAEEALRLLSGKAGLNTDRSRQTVAAVDVSALAPAPPVSRASALVAESNDALQEGLRLLRQGLHMEASRVLNDALGRMPADGPVATRIELLLMAGLADSNIGFFAEGEERFARADALIQANPNVPEAQVLVRKRRTYAALDLLNRRNFTNAIGELEALASGPADPGQPLSDPTVIRALNQSGRSEDGSAMLAGADVAALSQLVIDAQASWARSVALLAQNRPEEAQVALHDADRTFAVLRGEPVDQQQIRWLDARIERQRARILARSNDWDGAIDALDKAIASLEQAGASGTSFGPTLAETRLQRAAIAASGGNKTAALEQFELGIEELIASDSRGATMPPSLERYLDLLVSESTTDPAGNSGDKFFRAIQAVGDPEVARQFVQLQSVVTADSSLAAKVQDLTETERELTRIRFEIAGTPNDQPEKIAELDTERVRLEGALVQLESELAADKSYGAVNDAPVTLAELRAALQPGEAYLKLIQLRNYAFGILVDGQGAQIYRVAVPLVELNPLIDAVRASIDGAGGTTLPVFNVAASNALFRLIAGPAANRLLAAQTLVVDPSGPLQKLPIGVLVTDRASVESFQLSRDEAAYDYSAMGFLARRVSLSSALSPRSLIASRELAASAAPLPFIGFAEHMPAPFTGQGGNVGVSVGTGCEVELAEIAALTRQLTPIDKQELVRAASALGLLETPMVTDGAFTDTAIKQRTDLDQFQVLHFATHGLTEGQWGCAKSPPALVTSLGSSNSDALLSFDEIARLRLDANLVVLSACDTAAGIEDEALARASGLESTGASIEGLVRSFLAANARAVLTTYWPISNDGESEQLIENFYGAARTGTIGEALKVAQNAMIAQPESSHPRYWGAFFVIGDAAKPLLTGQALAQLAIAPRTELAQNR